MTFTFQGQYGRVLTDHFEGKISQVESSKQIIFLPKVKKNTKNNTEQKVKKVKRKVGKERMELTLFYLWSRGNSKKKS